MLVGNMLLVSFDVNMNASSKTKVYTYIDDELIESLEI